MPDTAQKKEAFTLVELSIVLVIIGLIIGGILVGQDLIKAATVRQQITQIEKYQTAVNTFRGKYGYLPGDIPDPAATQFGFTGPRTQGGQGDGNGLLDGGATDTLAHKLQQGQGETGLFWSDLGAAHLIDGSFTAATAAGPANATSSQLPLYLPPAKIGGGNYTYVFENAMPLTNISAGNFFGIISASAITNGQMTTATTALSVLQAYNIDSKIDDGMPFSGNVQTLFITTAGAEQNASPASGACNATSCVLMTVPTPYCTTYQSGSAVVCPLSFKFQ